ncbi:hotdog fold thioesterase [Pseudonocardia sp. NPDC049154]|uniref:PaaI family thioesterase n=1 Tax=Pseudonocardia sp. NPDC049154 TaxID=3155501 RepID=UPI0033F26C01
MSTETGTERGTGRRPSCSLDDTGLVEPRLGVLGCEVDEHYRYCSARSDAWPSTRPGQEEIGGLAVLVDHILGEVGNHPQPEGFLPLTVELSLDVLVPPPWHGEVLTARARKDHDDFRATHSCAEITDEAGRLVATASAWTTYAPSHGRPALPVWTPAVEPLPLSGRPLVDMLGVTATAVGTSVELTGLRTADWTNAHGSLHGGVWAMLAEIAAADLFGSGERPLQPSHLHLAFLRPGRTDTVRMRAEQVHRGRSLGVAQVEGRDLDERVCVRGTVTARP